MKTLRYLALIFCAAAFTADIAFAIEDDELPPDAIANAHVVLKMTHPGNTAHLNGQAHARHGIANIDSLVNWNDHFFSDGYDPSGNPQREWYTNTVGNPPQHGGTTLINTPIVPVIVDLRNADGSPRFVNGQPLISYPDAFVMPVVNSPIFVNANWTSSPVPTQMTDAIQRASYINRAKDDWHTLLVPSVKTARRLVLNKGSYYFALNNDGSCCLYILADFDAADNAMFPPNPSDTTTVMGAAENAGDITTKDISVFLFPNTALYVNDVSNCCYPGYHNWDFHPGDPNARTLDKYYVMAWVSWLSPVIWGPGFEDIVTLSHEIAEAVNDPFPFTDNVHNITPWWLAPNGFCSDFLEVGDGLVAVPNWSYPITMNGMTYHPQNEILVPWFKREAPSSALDGAYTYPNETVLTRLSDPQTANCQ
jgi:hypothetical protein